MRREAKTAPTRRQIALISASAVLALLVAIVVVVIGQNNGGTATGFTTPPASTVLRPGSRAPLDISLVRLGGGPRVVLSQIAKRQALVLNFFASDCPACEREIAAFSHVWKEKAKTVRFVGIDTNDPDPRAALRLLQQDGSTYPVGIDSTTLSVATSYGIANLPTTFFIGRDGRVESEVLGAMTVSQLTSHVAALLGSKN